jgi:hypothetical protein
MKSLLILRIAFCALFLAVAGTAVADVVTNGFDHATESIASTAFVGLFGAIGDEAATKALTKKKRGAFSAVAAVGVVLLNSVRSQTVGQQNLAGRNQATAGARGGTAGAQQSGMTTGYNMVKTESTMAGLLSFSISADGTHTKTNKIAFLPYKSTNTLPTGVTFSGSNFADYDDYRDFYIDNEVILGDILVTTDVQANYTNPITSTKLSPNGAPQTSNLSWNAISKNPSDYDQTTRIVYNSGWTIGDSGTFYELTLNVSSSMSFDCKIDQVADVKAFRPYNG